MTVRPTRQLTGLSAALALLAGLFFAPPLLAEDYRQLEQRLRIIESKLSRIEEGPGLPQASAGSSSGMPRLVEDVQRLQEEVRQLRGEVERLQHEAEQNRQRQRDMFIDVEKRLAALEQGRAGGNAGIAPPPTTGPSASPPGAPTVIRPPEDIPADGATATGGAGDPATGDADTAPAAPPAAASASEQDEYLKAFEILKQARYDDSITAFQRFLEKYPDGTYADNARYWLAETYYVKKDYQASLTHFQQLLTEHPNSSKLPGALLKLGYIQYELGNNAEARLALERVRNEFSGSSVADLAVQRLERMDREGR